LKQITSRLFYMLHATWIGEGPQIGLDKCLPIA
jgi:hypothetical protein